MDARRDLDLRAPGRRIIGRGSSPRAGRRVGGTHAPRRSTLSGVGRDHAIDALAAALAIPLATEPHLRARSRRKGRGAARRIASAIGRRALARLLEEVAAAGAEQVILVIGPASRRAPHELSAERGDLRGTPPSRWPRSRAAAFATRSSTGRRFPGLFVVRPAHNPLGPLDFDGVYDERSDRVHSLAELVDRGYEDAYRQFIEPVVAASGERSKQSNADWCERSPLSYARYSLHSDACN